MNALARRIAPFAALAALLAAALVLAQTPLDAWRQVLGPFREVRALAVGARGAVGAIDAAGNVFRRDPVTGAWQGVGDGMARLAIDAADRLWAVDRAGVVKRLDSAAGWVPVGAGAVSLAIGPDGRVVVATNAGTLAQYDPDKSAWSAIPGAGMRVAIDASGLLWSVAASGAIARRLGDAWIGLPGNARDIAADGAGNVLIIARDGTLQEWVEEEVRWRPVAGAPAVAALAVGAGQVWRADDDGIVQVRGLRYAGPAIKPVAPDPPVRARNLAGTPDSATIPDRSDPVFVLVAASAGLNDLSIGYDGSVFGTSATGAIQRWSNAQRRFNAFPGFATRLEVNEAGLPLVVNGGNAILRHDGTAWRRLPAAYPFTDLAGAGNAVLMAVSPDAQLYRIDLKGDVVTATRLAGNVERVAAAPDGGFWYRNDAGLMFQCDRAARCERRAVTAVDFAIGPGGTLFVVDRAGNLLRQNRGDGGFDVVRRGNVARVAVGPNDRPWIIETSGNVLASRLFERDEGGDPALARATEATAALTQPATSVTATGSVTLPIVFLAVDVPIATPGQPNLGAGLLDLTVGLDDQIIVTGFDAGADPCSARSSGWKGRNWIYSPQQRRFLHLDALKRVQYQSALAGRVTTFGQALPVPAGAPAVPAFYGSVRGCERYYTVEYDATTFAGNAEFYSAGGLPLGESTLTTRDVPVSTRERTAVLDMDITLDGYLAVIFPERKIQFVPLGALCCPPGEFPGRADRKFARVGIGATRDTLWAIDVDADVYEYVKATDRFEKRNLLDADRAQDVGVGKDGSVFIVDTAGRLKKWDAARKTFVYTGHAGYNRVAVTSRGKPVVANFPASQRVFIGQ